MATSITLSAMSASLWRSIEPSAEARTIAGSRCRKGSRRKELPSSAVPSSSPSSCCVGFPSPSSSPLISFEAAVRLISCLESIVGVRSGWLQEEVPDFHRELGAQGANDMIKPRLLRRDAPGPPPKLPDRLGR